ncbi:J domain-containing protein [Lamellibrachia satsuma]|nr:J domain-containing protein [Lamellibrachia satsuma]
MAGMEFEYDEEGGTFYFFLLSFMALVLVPATYYLWGTGEGKEDTEKSRRVCQCDPCKMKKQKLKSKEPVNRLKRRAIKTGLLIGWALLAAVAYKASQVELDFAEFDPYSELKIDRGATNREIKKAYHKLSIIFHPDKDTGDSQKFMKITKAYKALTDEEARKNWEEYGNPDGPGATHFGIALPKWIVEKQNSVWVLGLYALVFMVVLPVVVGTWWYRSIKYSAEQILMDTTQLYFIFFHKTPNMMLKRVLMVLAASFEFNRQYNQEVVERPSDNEQIPRLMKNLPYLNEKNKERPLCCLYSIKARCLIHAHLSRLELPQNTLEPDKDYCLKKCLYLLNEMINIVAQLVTMAHAGRVSKMPRLTTVENIMKVSQMVVQALWDNKSSLLQLPHISEDQLRHFVTRKRNIRNIRQLVSMREDERRALLRTLADDEYANVMNVCANLPYVEMTVKTEVIDEEDPTITAGSIVTVTVKLNRQNMEVLLNLEGKLEDIASEEVKEIEEDEEEKAPTDEQVVARKPKVWEKQKKKKGKAKTNKKKPVKPLPTVKKATTVTTITPTLTPTGTPSASGDKEELKDSNPSTPNGGVPRQRKGRHRAAYQGSTDEESDSDSNYSDSADELVDQIKQQSDNNEDDDDDWMKFQEEAKKENMLETKSKETHVVHCPYYPAMKYEWWWLYVADKKNQLLISAPLQVCSLKSEEEIQLKFSAPLKPGIYHYTVVLRSDSYLDFDQSQNIKLDVKEAKKVESHPQWEISDDDEEKDADDEDGSESDVSDYDESDMD